MIAVFKNNAASSLAAPLAIGDTAIQLLTGGGEAFPTLIAGQFFPVTLVDEPTRLLNEVCYCTAIAGDVLTVSRAQEGSVERAWVIGDLAFNQFTAATIAGSVQTTAAYTVPLLAAGVQDAVQTISLVGARVGDLAQAAFSVDLAGCSLRAWISAPGVAKYVFANPTGAPLAIGAGVVTLRVTHT